MENKEMTNSTEPETRSVENEAAESITEEKADEENVENAAQENKAQENAETGNITTGRRRKILWVSGIAAVIAAAVYLGTAAYFESHYLPRTEINGHDISGKTVEQAEEMLAEDVNGYKLVLTGITGDTEEIAGSDISIKYEGSADAKEIMEEQNGFLWPAALFQSDRRDVGIKVSYDAEKLKERIETLRAVTGEQTPATSAYPRFDGEQFVVEPEQYGTAVERKVLDQKIADAVTELDGALDLESEECYALPEYTSESAEVLQACDRMNEYCRARIVYPMDEDVVVDAAVISGWLTVDEKMKVSIDEDAVRLWLKEFGDKYDTVGSTRSFTTPAGKEATVKGGTYGWSINEEAEFDVIIDALKNGKTLEREPEYYLGGTAAVHSMPDWGDTYVDVDLSEQHMWYVVDGKVALETDVVTGEPIPEKITPEGTYTVLEKLRNTVLVGSKNPATGKPSYETPVSYWMRVTWSGIGFHDATWQPAFGGSLNQTPGTGSHGCINMPLDQASALYDILEIGTPVVIHY